MKKCAHRQYPCGFLHFRPENNSSLRFECGAGLELPTTANYTTGMKLDLDF
jgi:hypothetical protein